TDPALHQMVVIGHSQGGLLTKMLVVDPATRLWDTISRRPLADLYVSPETRELLQRALFVRPLPFDRRVIFIATPHGGSSTATGLIVRTVSRFVRLPGAVVSATTDLLEGNSDALLLDPRRPDFGSVYGMRPGSPFLRALLATPIAPGIAAHSIIPVTGAGPGPNASDGVVTYQSAHIDGVESELVIPFAGHSVQGHPLALEEVRRILLEHAAAVCASSGIGCGPGVGGGDRERGAAPAGRVDEPPARHRR